MLLHMKGGGHCHSAPSHHSQHLPGRATALLCLRCKVRLGQGAGLEVMDALDALAADGAISAVAVDAFGTGQTECNVHKASGSS